MLTAEKLMVEVGETGVDETRAKLRGLGDDAGDGSSSGWAGRLARAGSVAFAGLAAAGTAAAGYGLKIAASNETASISFNTLLGPAASGFMTQLQQFAATTPFEFPQLRDAASQLLAAGANAQEVIPLMTALGDATSAMGTGSEGISRATLALSQMSAAGRVTGQDMLQLTQAGVPAWQALASVLGTDVAGAQDKVSSGQVQVQQLFDALETHAGPALQKVNGMMTQQSASLTGLLSTLKDNLSMGLGNALGPAVEQIKTALPGITTVLTDALNSVGPQLGQMLSTLVGTVAQLAPVLAPILGLIATVANAVLGALGPAFTALAPYITQIATLLGGALAGALNTLAPFLPPLVSQLGQFLVAVAPLLPPLLQLSGVILTSLLPAAMPLIGVLTNLVTALVGTQAHAGPLVGIINSLATVIGLIPTPVLTAALAAFIGFETVGPILTVTSGAIDLVSGATTAFGIAMDVALGPVGLIIAAVVALGLVAYEIYDHWDAISGFFADLFGHVEDIVGGAIGWIRDHLGQLGTILLAVMTGGMSLVVTFLFNHWEQIKSGATAAVGAVVGFFMDLPGRIVGALGNLGGLLLGAGQSVVNGLVGGVQWAAAGLWSFLSSIPGRIFGTVGDISRLLWNTGADLIRGLIDGIGSMFGSVKDKLGDLTGKLTSWKGPPDVDRGLLHGSGQLIMQGFMAGIDSQVPALRNQLAGITDQVALGGSFAPFPIAPGAGAAAAYAGGASSSAPGGALVPITLELDGRVLAQLLVDPLRGELVAYGQRTGNALFAGVAT